MKHSLLALGLALLLPMTAPIAEAAKKQADVSGAPQPAQAAAAGPAPLREGERELNLEQTASTDASARGCWARFFRRPEMFTLTGNAQIAETSRLRQWLGWNELVVGPGARLELFAAPGYAQSLRRFEPGERTTQVTAHQGSGFEQVRSVRLTCVEAQTPGKGD